MWKTSTFSTIECWKTLIGDKAQPMTQYRHGIEEYNCWLEYDLWSRLCNVLWRTVFEKTIEVYICFVSVLGNDLWWIDQLLGPLITFRYFKILILDYNQPGTAGWLVVSKISIKDDNLADSKMNWIQILFNWGMQGNVFDLHNVTKMAIWPFWPST